MADLEAVELLTQAKERIFENGWGTGPEFIRDLNGDHKSLCLEDALGGRRGYYLSELSPDITKRAAGYVRSAVGCRCELYNWNDLQESAGVIFDALDAAILLAKESISVSEIYGFPR